MNFGLKRLNLAKNIPVSKKILEEIFDETGFDQNNLSIRETNRLATIISKKSNIEFIRMEMGIPNIPPSNIAKEAEKEAIDKGMQGFYPPFDGIPELKFAGSEFVKAFLDINVGPENVIPTCGSLQGGYISQALAGNMYPGKDTILYLDPTFPVTRYQAKFLGLNSKGIELYDNRGDELIKAINEKVENGNIGGILWSSPNNPSWSCLTESELEGIADICDNNNILAIEDLAYLGMDFRKDYSQPHQKPYIPTIGKFGTKWVTLISASKAFSLPGPRCGLAIISPKLDKMEFQGLEDFCGRKRFGHAFSLGGLYVTTSGVSHTAQFALAKILKASTDGEFNFVKITSEYGERAKHVRKLFLKYGFKQVYKKDMDETVGDGFYLTMSYPNFDGNNLMLELMRYGISTITLKSTGSNRHEGLRICISFVDLKDMPLLEEKLKRFMETNT
ncbi:MAG: aminotransferase [Methanobacteriota archaeon]|jgi:aspartate/methionine/tyrosine aminotransferase|nr:MAG: aminotransferase [Euryarchaeota archaeon]